ncbi:MAG: hypothetical protein Q8M91_02870, partial [Polaromonas sp.]|nr:hypothetical protein [Polaromonas sp.]
MNSAWVSGIGLLLHPSGRAEERGLTMDQGERPLSQASSSRTDKRKGDVREGISVQAGAAG